MERPKSGEGEDLAASCWGRLKSKLSWVKRESNNLCFTETKPFNGGFRYDPLSYAHNFDEGLDEDQEPGYRSFYARYAAPSKSLPKK